MNNKKNLTAIKVVCMVVLTIITVLQMLLWFNNDCKSYYIVDEKYIGNIVMYALYAILALALIIVSLKQKKFAIFPFVLINIAPICYLKLVMKYEAEGGLQYLKIDRVTITMSLILLFSYITLSLYRFKNTCEESVPFFITVLGFMGMIMSHDLVWMAFFSMITAFGVYLWSQGHKQVITNTVLISGTTIGAAAILAAKKLEYTTFQTVVVCNAMRYDGSAYVEYVLLGLAAIILLLCIRLHFTNDNSMAFSIFMETVVLATFVLNIVLRFTPTYNGTISGNVVKYAGAVMFFIAALYVLIQKQWEKVVTVAGMEYIFMAIAFAGSGIPISTWYAVMITYIVVPIVIVMVMNEYSGRFMYFDIMPVNCIILSFIAMACFRMSVFKSYMDMENSLWTGLMIASFIVMSLGLIQWEYRLVKRGKNSDSSGRISLVISTIILIGIEVLMPLITKVWTYSLLSQTDLMVANIMESKIPTIEITITAIMTGLVFVAPLFVVFGNKLLGVKSKAK